MKIGNWLLFSLGLYLVWAYAPEGDSPLRVMDDVDEVPERLHS